MPVWPLEYVPACAVIAPAGLESFWLVLVVPVPLYELRPAALVPVVSFDDALGFALSLVVLVALVLVSADLAERFARLCFFLVVVCVLLCALVSVEDEVALGVSLEDVSDEPLVWACAKPPTLAAANSAMSNVDFTFIVNLQKQDSLSVGATMQD